MADGMADISIVIPTYNHEQFILASLESVSAQTYRDFEVIVVNDGSPDNTSGMLAPLVASGNIRYIEQNNAGQGAARNRGLQAARGKYIAFLDDDDLWPPDKLEWQVRELEAHPDAVLVYGYMETFGAGNPFRHPEHNGPSGDVRKDLLRTNFLRSPGQTLIRSAALGRIGGFDPTIWGADDWDLWIRLSRTGPFLYRPRPALRYRIHAHNASQDALRLCRNSLQVLQKNFGAIPRLDNLLDWAHALVFILLSSRSLIRRSISCTTTDSSVPQKAQMLLLRFLFGLIGFPGKFLLQVIERAYPDNLVIDNPQVN